MARSGTGRLSLTTKLSSGFRSSCTYGLPSIGFVSSASVLLVGHLLQPVHASTVQRFRNGEMRHRVLVGRAVPVLDAGWRPDHVAWLDFLLRPALLLDPAGSGRHDQQLPRRMGVPRRARPKLERDGAHRGTPRRSGLEQRIDSDGAAEVLLRALCGGL